MAPHFREDGRKSPAQLPVSGVRATRSISLTDRYTTVNNGLHSGGNRTGALEVADRAGVTIRARDRLLDKPKAHRRSRCTGHGRRATRAGVAAPLLGLASGRASCPPPSARLTPQDSGGGAGGPHEVVRLRRDRSHPPLILSVPPQGGTFAGAGRRTQDHSQNSSQGRKTCNGVDDYIIHKKAWKQGFPLAPAPICWYYTRVLKVGPEGGCNPHPALVPTLLKRSVPCPQ